MVKILALADDEYDMFYKHYTDGVFKDYDLILSAGDLSRHYLEFIATMSNKPIFYVRGNHDDSFNDNPPGGCICIDGDIVDFNGIKIAGFGGSMKYKYGLNMYTEAEMKKRIKKLWFKLFCARKVDILLTHSPAFGICDMEDLPHRGFKAFLDFIDKYSPKLMIHGHVHSNYGIRIPIHSKYRDTEIINCYKHQVIEFDNTN